MEQYRNNRNHQRAKPLKSSATQAVDGNLPPETPPPLRSQTYGTLRERWRSSFCDSAEAFPSIPRFRSSGTASVIPEGHGYVIYA